MNCNTKRENRDFKLTRQPKYISKKLWKYEHLNYLNQQRIIKTFIEISSSACVLNNRSIHTKHITSKNSLTKRKRKNLTYKQKFTAAYNYNKNTYN